MSNVLIGIVGVILFIGLALAGAIVFGPVVTDVLAESKANGTMKTISSVAKAVAIRNRELETSTPAASTPALLVPQYLDEIPLNPVNANPVLLISEASNYTGAAAIVASKMPTDGQAMCEYLNRNGGGPVGAIPMVTSVMPAQLSGCVRASGNFGPFSNGDYVAYIRVT